MSTLSSIHPGKPQGQRSLMGYWPWSLKRVGDDLATKQQQYYMSQSPITNLFLSLYTHTHIFYVLFLIHPLRHTIF